MKPKNTIGFVCLIVLFAMGCERTLNDILTKSDNVVRPLSTLTVSQTKNRLQNPFLLVMQVEGSERIDMFLIQLQ